MFNILLILEWKCIFMSKLKQPIIRILYRLNAVAKYWYLKIEEEKIPKKNSAVSFNRGLSTDEKLKLLNMQKKEVFMLY